jgi:hypothetical protein
MRQYKSLSLVARKGSVSLLPLGFMFLFFLFFFLRFSFVTCKGWYWIWSISNVARALHVFLFCSVPSKLFVSVFLLLSFTMSLSSGDNGSVLDCVAQGPSLAAKFHTGWEGWLEGARFAHLASK